MLIKKSKIPIKKILVYGFLPSFLKKIIYRLKGYEIGKKVTFGFGSVIIGRDVCIGDNTKFGFFSIVRGKAIKIGRFVKIGAASIIDTPKIFIDDDARINEQVYIGGLSTPKSDFKLGKRTIIMQLSFINPAMPIEIGDDTGIGGHCLLFTHGSWLPEIDGFPVTFAPIRLGKKVWLPWRVFILPGVSVGDNVVVGADSLVNKDLPSNCLAVGSPIKVISENYPKKMSETEKKSIIERILKEFEAYLRFNGFQAKINKTKHGIFLDISSKIQSSAFVLYEYTEIEPKVTDNVLVLCHKKDIRKIYKNKKFKMIISLDSRERLGSSKVGEEITSFFSRYGIRFDRID